MNQEPELSPAPSHGVRAALLAAAREELIERGHAAISLRAIARRAGVSHAAPKYHFHDRAGLLTAIAAEGFSALTATLADTLRRNAAATTRQRVAALGRAYIDFGLAQPALFDLMFRPTELHVDDPALDRARRTAITALSSAVDPSPSTTTSPPEMALICWALVHGLTVLTRDGSLRTAAGTEDVAASASLARHLADAFTTHIVLG